MQLPQRRSLMCVSDSLDWKDRYPDLGDHSAGAKSVGRRSTDRKAVAYRVSIDRDRSCAVGKGRIRVITDTRAEGLLQNKSFATAPFLECPTWTFAYLIG